MVVSTSWQAAAEPAAQGAGPASASCARSRPSSSSFSLLSGLLLLSVLGLPLIFQPQFLYLPLLVEKTLSLLGSFSFFFFLKFTF